ncbi:phosphodiester glycosidase family protein [Motilibacter deserti]|uniref:phosphodiester glycosidase family protein n=1 Tax=Motilibacter deserti TaxID=2714956 RepID=UPI0018C8AA79|nr:phosphodiester glycosidase family protein [Motilibacter deserti]
MRRPNVPQALAAAILAPALVLSASPAYAAVPVPAPAGTGSSSAADLPDLALAPAGQAIVTDRDENVVAPGVTHTSFDRIDARGWIRGDVLVADLDEDRVTVDYLSPGTVSGRAVLSEQAARAGAVAGVNGDFFDINDTGAPLGVGLGRSGGLTNAPASGHNDSATIGADGLGRIAQVFLAGSASTGEGDRVTLANLNSPSVSAGGVGLYTPAWGAAPRTRVIDGVAGVREVLVRDGVVVANGAVGTTPLAADEMALVGREAGATALSAFSVGERVDVSYGPRSDAGDVAVAVSGNKQLVRDGVVLPVDDVDLHPRTAVGFSADGRRMVLVTIDGRQVDSRGMTERELGAFVRDLGADDVLNLDGGGSSTMLARTPGDAAPEVVNSPSDGGERLTPNGLGLLVAPGSGKLTGVHVEPVVEDERSERVLAGLSRVLRASGHDETYSPVRTDVRWHANPTTDAYVTPGADNTVVVTGRRPGDVAIEASGKRDRDVVGVADLVVLGAPVRLATTVPQVSLNGAGATGSFEVVGYDADGFSTWVEPRDVTLSYDADVVRVEAAGKGFRVTALRGDDAAAVTVTVRGLSATVPVTTGLQSVVVDAMDDLATWTANRAPATTGSAISTAPGRTGGTAIALDYSLTNSTATRAAYLQARTPFALPGTPQRIGAWVLGDGSGAWLRGNIFDAAGGAAKTIDLASSVNWTGWRYVEATVPAGLQPPFRFQRLYAVETAPTRQYSGRIVVDDLTVKVAREVSIPAAQQVVDPVVVTDGTVQDGKRWNFAVLSDVQFTADAPESDLVQQARRTIREVLAAGPEFLVINGDFLDRAFANDVALAKRVLDEEIGDRLPYYYVPGNHEASGPGTIVEWSKVFGAGYRAFDRNGTRFVLLDTSLGTLRGSGFGQIVMLRQALDSAESDPSVRSVVVMGHHPVDDPLPTKNSQLADRKEAQLLVDWLAAFRAETGKGAAYVASHAGVFGASRTDGVLLPLLGNAGKGPSSAPGAGGFTGWAMFGVNASAPLVDDKVRHRAAPERKDPDAWLRVDFRPHVDTLELQAPATLAVGASAKASATAVQDGRRVPVAYPVSADWSGSRELLVGDPDDVRSRHVAVLDPSTGTLTALKPGSFDLSVTVNGATRTVRVSVAAAALRPAA